METKKKINIGIGVLMYLLSLAASIFNIRFAVLCGTDKMIPYESFLWFTPLFLFSFWCELIYIKLVPDKQIIVKIATRILDIIAIALVGFWCYQCFINKTVFVS